MSSTAAVQLDGGIFGALAACENAVDKAATHRSRDPLRRTDPNLVKYLDRLHDVLHELDRLASDGRIAGNSKERLLRTLDEAKARMRHVDREQARTVLHDAQMLMLEVADPALICGLAAGELQWTKNETSWLTWDALFGAGDCRAVNEFSKGAVDDADVEAARHKLLTLYRARRDDELARNSRSGLREQNLYVLTAVLLVLIPAFLIAYAFAEDAEVWGTVMLPLAGAVGAAISGTLKARDRLRREGEIRRFRSGLIAQLLVGAAFGVIIVFILQGGIVKIGDLTLDSTTVATNAAFAFIAGFSEPFALRTVERAASLGTGDGADSANEHSDA